MSSTSIKNQRKSIDRTIAKLAHEIQILKSIGGSVVPITNRFSNMKAAISKEYASLILEAEKPKDRTRKEILKDALKQADTPELKKEIRGLIKLEE